jgi:phage shock protein PspC (stress-responsive transcriptional regulator)
MTTTNPGQAGPPPGYPWTPPGPRPAPRPLRRSTNDRIISGVAGGLGEYFGVDAVIFRVLFAVLSFFGGVGLLAYALAWLLVPEPGVSQSVLDKAVHQLRVHRIPPWLVIFGGVLLLWITWFSWWAPGPTFPALLLLAVLAVILLHRLGRPAGVAGRSGPWRFGRRAADDAQWTPPPAGVDPEYPTGSGFATGEFGAAGAAETGTPEFGTTGIAEPAGFGTAEYGSTEPGPVSLSKDDQARSETRQLPPAAPLIAPLNDTRRSMQAWLMEAGEAHRARIRRRRPIKVGVGLALVAAWAFVALLDAFSRVPFPAYLWVGLIILGAGLLISLVTRRMVLSLLIPIVLLSLAALALGGTRASLSDGSGQVGWMPTSADQLGNHRLFAGQSTLDLTALPPLTEPRTISITQAAGEVRLLIPKTLNATVIADVHLGDIRNGTSQLTGQRESGLNVHSELAPPTGSSGALLTIRVHLTDGHVQVDPV